jgi:hypothetical protein
MGFNKKVLSKAVSELGKAKAPGKPKDIITDPAGQWKYPGQKTRIPGNDITMQGVPYPVWAQPNVGPGSMMQPNQDYNFPGASYVDETPMAKKGGSKLGTINLNPNPLSHYELNYGFNLPTKENGGEADYEDLDLTDEEIQAYRDGGYVVEELPEAQDGGPQNTAGPRAEEIPVDKNAMNAMMKARMATENEFKNPAAQRMVSPNPKTYEFGNGDLGTHFMASMGNQAVPLLQDKGGNELEYNENPPPSKEDINFRTPEEAQYFAEHYKEVAPMMKGFKAGGFVQHELVKAQTGLATASDSLSLYNNAIKLKGFYDNLKPYYNNPEIGLWYDGSWDLKNIQKETLAHPSVSSSNKTIIKNNKNANAIYMSDVITGAIDPKAPLLKYDTRIKPQGQITYQPKKYTFAENVSPDIAKIQKMTTSNAPSYSNSWTTNIIRYKLENDPIKKANYKKKLINIGAAIKLKDPEKSINEWIYRTKKDEEIDKKLPGYITTLPYYDPLAIKPANMLSDDEIKIRFKKYGASGIPQSKLKTLGLSSSIQSVKPIDKKPVNKKILDKNGNTPTADYLKKYPVKPVEEVTPLKPISYQEFTRPEQQIILAKPYKKPVHYAGPRYGVLAGDENLDLPEGYTQEQREAARRKRDSDTFQQKNLEYQQQQRGAQPVVTRKYGGILHKAQTGRTVTHTNRDDYNKAFAAESDSLSFYNSGINNVIKADKTKKTPKNQTINSATKKYESYNTSLKNLKDQDKQFGIKLSDKDYMDYLNIGSFSDKTKKLNKPVGFVTYNNGLHRVGQYKKPVIHNVYKKPVQPVQSIEEVTPLNNIPYQEFKRPEQSILSKPVREQMTIPVQKAVQRTLRVPVQGVEDYWIKDPVLGNIKRQRPVTTYKEVPWTDEAAGSQNYNINTGTSNTNVIQDNKKHLKPAVLTENFKEGGEPDGTLPDEEWYKNYQQQKAKYESDKAKGIISSTGYLDEVTVTPANNNRPKGIQLSPKEYAEKYRNWQWQEQSKELARKLHGPNFGPQSAGSADWFWTLPFAAPAALEAAGAIGAMSLPGMAAVPGATVGNAAMAAGMANSFYQTPKNVRDWYDVSQGTKDWKEAAAGTAEIAAGLIGSKAGFKSVADDVAQGAKTVGKALGTETGLLSKVSDVNPWAWKPEPTSAYRMLGKEGLEDAQQSGVFRSNQVDVYDPSFSNKAFEETYYSQGVPFDAKKYKFPQEVIDKTSFAGGKNNRVWNWNKFEGPHMVEVTNSHDIANFNTNGVSPFENFGYEITTPGNAPLSFNHPNVNVYKQHWLQGYKKVPRTKWHLQPATIEGGFRQGGALDSYQKKGEVQPKVAVKEKPYNFYTSPLGQIVGQGLAIQKKQALDRYNNDQNSKSNAGWSNEKNVTPSKKKPVQPTVQQKTAQKLFDEKFKVTGKDAYTKVKDKIATSQKDYIASGKKNGYAITQKDLDDIENMHWKSAGVGQIGEPDAVQAAPTQSNSNRAWEYITNPFTAAEYAISGGGAENMPHNINEMRMAGIDPGVVEGRNLVGNTLNSTLNLFDAGDKVVRNIGKGNYGSAFLEGLRFIPGSGLLDDAVRLGVKPGVKYLGKALGTETGLLSKVDDYRTPFQSEINWGNWNKEILADEPLLKEYSKIEEATKTNGTWMKNSDGSAYKGTPEQFVQQNSENFKNAFGDNYVTGYHGSNKGNIQEFRKGKVGDLEDGVYLANSPKDADSYRLKLNPFSKRYELAAKTKNPLIFDAKNKLWTKLDHDELINRIGQENFNVLGIKPKKKYDTAEVTDIAKKLGYDAVNFKNIKDAGMYAGFNGDVLRGLRAPINKNNYSIINPKNIKSLLRNNGKFDMTNPNIYKAAIPLTIGTGAALDQWHLQPATIEGGFKNGGILDKAQGGKTVYKKPLEQPAPQFNLLMQDHKQQYIKKNSDSPELNKQDLVKKYQQELNKEKAIKLAKEKLAKQKAINDAIPRGPVSDNTRTVIPKQVVSDINNAAFYNSPQETAKREARKKEQAAFEKEQWNKYNKMSFAEKALDVTQAAIAHPILMAGNALTGNQAYIPGMGRGLMNTESPEYDKYLKATGQTKGQFEISDLANIVNPGYWGGHAGNELHKGNYATGLLETGLAFAGVPGSGRTAIQGVKSLAQDINQGAKYLNQGTKAIGKTLPGSPNAVNMIKGIGKLPGRFYDVITKTPERLKTLREAENWMQGWVSHPATQEKIINSYKESLKSPNYHSVFGTVENSPIAKHNLEEVIKFTSGYKPAGRLQEYPIIEQLTEFPNIHKDNAGINYTHEDIPGEILNMPENTYIPLSKNKLESEIPKVDKLIKTKPNALDTKPQFIRHGNWVSRWLDPKNRLSTGIHELTHDWTKAQSLELTDQKKIIEDAIDYPYLKERKKINNSKEVDKLIDYLSDPTEVQARIMELRKYFDLSPDDIITPEQADKMFKEVALGNTPVDTQFVKIIKKDNGKSAAKLFNKVWAVAPIAGTLGVGALQQEKNGGDIESWEDDLDDDEIKALEKAGYIIERIK